MTELTDEEIGRRLSAARGYHRETFVQFAERLGKNRETIKRYETGKFAELGRPGVIERYVEKTDLPRTFFVINLQRLPEMEKADRLVQVMAPSERASFEERALEKALADESQLSGANGSGSAGSEPESETR